jgi:hypothetical protein
MFGSVRRIRKTVVMTRRFKMRRNECYHCTWSGYKHASSQHLLARRDKQVAQFSFRVRVVLGSIRENNSSRILHQSTRNSHHSGPTSRLRREPGALISTPVKRLDVDTAVHIARLVPRQHGRNPNIPEPIYDSFEQVYIRHTYLRTSRFQPQQVLRKSNPLPPHCSIFSPASDIMADDCSGIQGYVAPNFPRPDSGDSACIIIFGYASPALPRGNNITNRRVKIRS